MLNPQIKVDLPFFKNGLHQIGIIVEDIDTAVETYHKLLGIGPWVFYTYGAPLVKKMSYRGRPGNYKMRIALAQIGQLQIELIQPLEGENIYADFVDEHGYGPHHIAAVVEDAQAATAQAEAAGLKVIQDGHGFGLDGDGSYIYFDTEAVLGLVLEFVELPKRRVQPEKVYPPPNTDTPST